MKNLACLALLFMSSTLALEPNPGLLVTSNRFFTPELYKAIENQNQSGNFMFSPFSIQLGLLFLEAGCIGGTADQILFAIHTFLFTNEALANATKSLIPSLICNQQYTLSIVNGIFVQEKFIIKDDFKRNASEVFYAKTQNVDFAKNTETAKTINSWVGNETDNKIQDLVDASSLNNRTRIVLVNALYFKGNWVHSFFHAHSNDNKFYKTPTDIIYTEMMTLNRATLEYVYCKRSKAQFLKLPITGENAAMIIVLPTEKDGLANLEKSPNKIFTPRKFHKQEVHVRLPKFFFRSTFKLNSILKELGIVEAFDPVEADLSGIAGQQGNLSVTDVIQKTYIQVSQDGVEAAAATAVVVDSSLAVVKFPENAINVICDHPFIFYIEVENLILFAGRVVNPNSSH